MIKSAVRPSPQSQPGAEIAASLQSVIFSDLKAPIGRVAALDSPIPVHPLLESIVLPSTEKIVEGVRGVL